MAEGGYTSSETALEAKRGWAMVVGAGKQDVLKSLDHWTSTEGEDGLAGNGTGRWEILRNSFKPFPCGIVIHPIIDACIQLHAEITKAGHNPQQITSVTAEVHPLVLELTGKKTPKDGLEAKFSVYHSGACGLLLGKSTPTEYEDELVLDRATIAVRDAITANIDPNMAPDAAKVTAVLQNGDSFTKHVEHAVGSRINPLSDETLQTKFKENCRSASIQDVEAVSRKCWDIVGLGDMRDLTA
jgi:2-methylcitrate dehydratase PrpD